MVRPAPEAVKAAPLYNGWPMKPGIPFILALLVLATPVAGQADPSAEKPRLSRLQGRAAVDRRNEVMGATVLVHALGDPSHVYVTSTGAAGAFHVDGLSDGEYLVRVSRSGLRPVTKDRITVRFPFRAVVEITMSPGSGGTAPPDAASMTASAERVVLSGEIREREGGPMPEVRLRLVRIDGSFDPRSLRTGSDGRFEFADLPAGGWRLDIQGVGFLPMRQPLNLGRDTEASVTMVRQPAGYEPSPLELMPPEQPVPPADFDGPG